MIIYAIKRSTYYGIISNNNNYTLIFCVENANNVYHIDGARMYFSKMMRKILHIEVTCVSK